MRSLLPILVFALGSTVTAAIPRAIPYQGILTDAAGNAKPDSTYSVTFKLYAAETGGSAVWSESREVESRSGLFAVMLGEGEALPADFSQTYWLGVTVGGGAEMAPRVKLGSAAYALHAGKADTAGYATSANSTANAAVAASAVMADSAKAVRAGGIGANTIDSAQIKDGGIAGADINPGATLNIASLGIGGPVTSSYGLQIKGRDKDISLTDSAGGAVRSLHIGIGNNVFGTSKPGVYINTQAESGTDAGYAFAVQDTSRLTITADGNIGIGTSQPSARLTVSESTDQKYLFAGVNSAGLNLFNFQVQSDGRTTFGLRGGPGGAEQIILDGNGDSYFNGGNVGIGTSSPSEKLEIRGKILVQYSGGTSDSTHLYSPPSGIHLINEDVNGINQGTIITFGSKFNGTASPHNETVAAIKGANDAWANTGSGCLQFFTSRSGAHSHLLERMRINSTGNVGIGDTTPTEAKLTVGGDIFANGYFVCTQGTACSSDRRLKSHLTPLDSSLCRLASLTGVYYDWDRESFPERNFPAGRQIGLIAQEVEEVYPELVRTDAEGFKSLSYDKLTAVLVEAVKELKKQNEALAEANKVQQDQIDLMRQEFEERLLALEQGR